MPAKFEVRSFNCVVIISTYFPKIGVMLPWPRPLFEKFLRGHVQTVPGDVPAKFEVCSFECIGSSHHLHYKIDRPKFADLRLKAVSP